MGCGRDDAILLVPNKRVFPIQVNYTISVANQTLCVPLVMAVWMGYWGGKGVVYLCKALSYINSALQASKSQGYGNDGSD